MKVRFPHIRLNLLEFYQAIQDRSWARGEAPAGLSSLDLHSWMRLLEDCTPGPGVTNVGDYFATQEELDLAMTITSLFTRLATETYYVAFWTAEACEAAPSWPEFQDACRRLAELMEENGVEWPMDD